MRWCDGLVCRVAQTSARQPFEDDRLGGLGQDGEQVTDDAEVDRSKKRIADRRHLSGHRLDSFGQHRRGRAMVEVDKGVKHPASLRVSPPPPNVHNPLYPSSVVRGALSRVEALDSSRQLLRNHLPSSLTADTLPEWA
jgi:hypothetical protein